MAEWEAVISENELTEWMTFYAKEPFGDRRSDIQSAQICALLANINRNPKKRSQPYRIGEYMLFQEKEEPKKQSPEEVIAIFKGIQQGFKKKKKRGGK